MGSLCVITARGGSKRIPHKNIRDFCGKPIIAYSIKAALESELFDEVMVSTDDMKIAEVARFYGASVPFMRSAETSDDFSTTSDVLSEVVGEYRSRGVEFDLLCCIYPTAPFVTAKKLREASELIDSSSSDMVCAISEFGFPPMRGFVERNGHLEYRFPEYALARSQDIEPMYQDAGQFYFYGHGAFSGNRVKPSARIGFLVPQTEVQDIDNLVDWELAEMKYRLMTK
ncbi:MAG: pseudaminic acid cytidylyltransferase [Coriobacteriales bacterium]|jgi:pseudaminic acid cytidylyltransferase